MLYYNRPMSAYFYEGPYYLLSNFSAHAIVYEGKLYPTSEHAYQATKFTDETIIEAIRQAPSPLQAKKVAKEHADAKNPDHSAQKVVMMKKILQAKAAQHQEVREALSKSGQNEIAEDSPIDYFWGRGADGSGQNQLGKLWMEIRTELQST